VTNVGFPRAVASREVGLLAIVLGGALVVRLWGITFGLPHVYHPDEGFEVYRALRLGMGGFDMGRVAKGGYYLILFVEYGLYFVWLFLTRAVSSVHEFAEYFVRDPSGFWKIGRVTTALMGTATVGLVWWQGRRMATARAGLLGALFLALSLRHVIDSHYVTVDVPMTLFTLWAIVMVVEDVAGRSRLRPWIFALVAAFAVLNKLPAVVLFVPYLVGGWLRGGFRGERGLLTWATIQPALYAAIIYCVANPGFVVSIAGTFRMVGEVVGGAEETGGEYAYVEQKANLWLFYGRVLLDSQGPGLLGLSLLGAGVGLARRFREALLHLLFVVPFFLLIAGATSVHLYYARYIVPLLPGLCLLAGIGLDELVRRLRGPESLGMGVAVALAGLVLVEPGLAVTQWNRRQSRTDTRTIAVEWIQANVPHRSRVLLEGFPEESAQLAIPIGDLKRNVREMIEELHETDPGKARFWELKIETMTPPLYDLVTVRHFEPWETLEDYLEDGVEYVVLRTDFFRPDRRVSRKHDPITVETRTAFYRELTGSSRAERLASFEADENGAPGFDIEIWRVEPYEDESEFDPTSDDDAEETS
jgi:hypothetical protein